MRKEQSTLIVVVMIIMSALIVGCQTIPIEKNIGQKSNIEITNMLWDDDSKTIEVTLNKFPENWGEWKMFINGKEVLMEGSTNNVVVRPNAPLDTPPTGLLIGTLPWISSLIGTNFPSQGTIQFSIPGVGYTNKYEYKLEMK